MLPALLIGSLAVIVNIVIQMVAVVALMRYLIRNMEGGALIPGFRTDVFALGSVLMILFVGHLLQFATWALLFVWLGEFDDLLTAFYHSAVNFTSLGYGDIVMGEKWRLLGALEAANGILMFGLSAGVLMSVMTRLFSRKTRRQARSSAGNESSAA